MDTKNIGLRNIEVADTKISFIDGQKGKLIYRGYDILDLTKNSNFEETCYLLLHDELPTKSEYDDFKAELTNARTIPKQMQTNMGNWRKMPTLWMYFKHSLQHLAVITMRNFQQRKQVTVGL